MGDATFGAGDLSASLRLDDLGLGPDATTAAAPRAKSSTQAVARAVKSAVVDRTPIERTR